MSKFNRRLTLIALSALVVLVYIVLHLNLLHLNRWNNAVQVLREGAAAGYLQPQSQPQSQLWPNQQQPVPAAAAPPSPAEADLDPAVSGEETPAFNAESESEFNVYLSTRRLVVLAVHRLNELLRRYEAQLREPVPCSPWWASPLDVQRHQVLARTAEYDDHLLEFVAASAYDNRTFAALARVSTAPGHDVLFVNDSFTRVLAPFQKFLFGVGGQLNKLSRCLTPERLKGSGLTRSARRDFENICSCNLAASLADNGDTGLDTLPTWPANSSFLVGDYMNFSDYGSMFYILPANRSNHCADSISMLVMVSSAPGHKDHRRAIRDTYGSRANLERNSADLVFLFGQVQDKALQRELEAEADMHGDLIQANFMDSYHNLTLSHLSMYSYVHYTCSQAQGKSSPNPANANGGNYNPPTHIYKADDDFLLNLDTARAVAKANPDAELFGCSYCGTPPIRNRAYMTKYYTPRYMYMGDVYVGYLSGVAYMIRSDVLPLFIGAAQSIPIIHMDDAYITGLVPASLGIYPRNSNFFGYGRVEPENGCELRRMGCSYVLNLTDMRTQWAASEGFRLKLEAGEEVATKNCTLATEKELKLAVVDDEFKRVCRYT